MRHLKVILGYLERPLLIAAIIIAIWLLVGSARKHSARQASGPFDYDDLGFVQRET